MADAPLHESRLAPWPFYGEDEIAAAAAVLKSGRVNYWTGGEGKAFEDAYAAHCGVRFALAVANGTVALELALHGLGIGPGDEVIVPARTFIATASAAALRGARPVVADVDPISQNMTAASVAAVLSTRTKAVIPVHLAGWPVEMDPLMDLAREKGLFVVEDCAQAHGARVSNRPVGGIGHIGCFSFCQDKIISTGGEGGMVVTDDPEVYRRMWSFRDHGRRPDGDDGNDSGAAQDTLFKWMRDSFGTNWRLTEMQSAIGRAQLAKLPVWSERRRANARVIADSIREFASVMMPEPPSHLHHAYYKFYFLLNLAHLKPGWTRDGICRALNVRGVPAGVGACPDISREKAFAVAGPQAAHPQAEAAGARSVILPVHPTLTPADMAFMAHTLRDVLAEAAR